MFWSLLFYFKRPISHLAFIDVLYPFTCGQHSMNLVGYRRQSRRQRGWDKSRKKEEEEIDKWKDEVRWLDGFGEELGENGR